MRKNPGISTEVPRYLAKYLGLQRAKILNCRLRYLELAELAEVPRYLARYLA